MLPNLIIPGTQRAGTTSLVENLHQHPYIWFPAMENHFFDLWDNPNAIGDLNSLEDYHNLYEGRDEKLLGDKTPCYMYFEHTRKLMKYTLPHSTKFIVCLRNPIDRAYSQHRKNVRDSGRDIPFEIAVDTCMKQDQPKQGALLKRGMYYSQLKDLLDWFDPANFHIVIQERMAEDTERTLWEIYEFLEVEPMLPPTVFTYEKGDYELMDDVIREELTAYFRNDVSKLDGLIDVDLGQYWHDFTPYSEILAKMDDAVTKAESDK